MRRQPERKPRRWQAAVLPVLATLSLWLVVQNVVLLVAALDQAPALITVTRALVKVAVRLVVPVAPVLAVAAGAVLLWNSDRAPAADSRMLEEARHGRV